MPSSRSFGSRSRRATISSYSAGERAMRASCSGVRGTPHVNRRAPKGLSAARRLRPRLEFSHAGKRRLDCLALSLLRDVGIDLRRIRTGVAEELLDDTEVRAAVQEVGGEGMTKEVGV